MPTARDWETRVLARIDRDELVELTRRAIGFASVNPPGDEAPLAEMLAAVLRREGISAELVAHGPGRASVAARLRGSGQRRGLILTGHLDVVGAGDRPWRHDPFGGEVVDGRVYGRGSCDMKGGVAAMLLAAAALRRAGASLARDPLLPLTAR